MKKAFTLVELIVVIAILAILSVTAFVTLTKWFGKSRDSRRTADLATIATAINTAFANPNKAVKLTSNGLTVVNNSSALDVFNTQLDSTAISVWNLDALTKVPMDPAGKYYAVGVYNSWNKAGIFYELGATLENDPNTWEPGTVAYVYGNYTAWVSISWVTYTSLIMSWSYTSTYNSWTFVTPNSATTWLPYTLE